MVGYAESLSATLAHNEVVITDPPTVWTIDAPKDEVSTGSETAPANDGSSDMISDPSSEC